MDSECSTRPWSRLLNVAFKALAYSHRKEYARWIEDASREETPQRGVEQALEMLRDGKTRS
jgi:uncharacterized protein YdeI (YjbR/CyaY-like superfamily)